LPVETKILILVSHDAFGEQLKMFIKDQLHCTIAGLATTGAAGLELARTTQPNVVLVDVGLQGNRGIGLVAKLKALQPDVRIVLMGDGDSTEYVEAAANVGALAYLPKKAISHQLPNLLGISTIHTRAPTRKLRKVTSQRGLVLEGAISGGMLVGGLAFSEPLVALFGATGVLILSIWHSARVSRSSRTAGSAPPATFSSQAPAVDRPYRAEVVRGEPGKEGRPF
jgi:ActR/RegA family two-component response regulator